MTQTLKTYYKWRELGFQVQRGSKASGRNADRKALFSKEQVQPLGRSSIYDAVGDYSDDDYEMDRFYMGCDPYFDNIGDR